MQSTHIANMNLPILSSAVKKMTRNSQPIIRIFVIYRTIM